jgi:hypothetical protein
MAEQRKPSAHNKECDLVCSLHYPNCYLMWRYIDTEGGGGVEHHTAPLHAHIQSEQPVSGTPSLNVYAPAMFDMFQVPQAKCP